MTDKLFFAPDQRHAMTLRKFTQEDLRAMEEKLLDMAMTARGMREKMKASNVEHVLLNTGTTVHLVDLLAEFLGKVNGRLAKTLQANAIRKRLNSEESED